LLQTGNGVNGSLGAHEWEGKSVRTNMNTFGQVHVHIRHHGGTERPEPCARAWFVHVGKSGACVWSLVVVVLRALVRGGERRMGMGGVTFSLHTYHVVA
jgi:hypothetical protein